MKKSIKTTYPVISLLITIVIAFSSLPSEAQVRAGFSSGFDNEIHCSLLHPLMRAFLQMHILPKKMDEAFYKEAAKQFVNRIDPSKGLLLQKDSKLITNMAIEFFKKSSKPNCKGLSAIPEMLARKSSMQLKLVQKILGNNYKFNENVKIITDTDKIKRAKDINEMKLRLEKYVHFQISNYLLNESNLKEAKEKLVKRYKRNVKRAKELDEQDMYELALNAFAVTLDPHSMYLSQESLEEFHIAMSLSLEGIGASLTSKDGYTVIHKLIPGGAAALSKKLKPKDKILFVGQGKKGPMEDIVDMSLQDVVKKIRGKASSTVRLGILRHGKENKSFVVHLKRAKVKLESLAAKVKFRKTKIGKEEVKVAHVLLPSFYGDSNKRSSYADLKKILEKVKKQKVAGVVLDFSSNGGGHLEEAVKIAGLFIKEGNVVTTKDVQKNIRRLKDRDKKIQYEGPLVILISRVSASASEIVAGALKDYKRAVIVGDSHTYGKGSVQALRPLPGIPGAIKVTTGLFFIPGGYSTQHIGVSSDVVLPSSFVIDKIGEKYLDNSLQTQSIDPFRSSDIYSYGSKSKRVSWEPVKKKELQFLRASSSQRVASSSEFKKIRKELKEIEEEYGVIDLAKIRKKTLQDRAKEEKKEKKGGVSSAAKEEEEEEDEGGGKKVYVDEAVNVLADLIALRRGLVNDKAVAKLLKKEAKTRNSN